MADEMPYYVGRQRLMLACQFLLMTFTKHTLPFLISSHYMLIWMKLAYGHQADIL